jgi:hypothetical protein
MNNYLLLISISYVALAVFVMWISFGKRPSMKFKIILSLLLPAVYYLHWIALQQSKGWPSDQTLPTQFELISADVVEPNPNIGLKGGIHLWIRPTDNGAPRAYALNYSRELHKKLFDTKQQIAQGRRQIGLLYDNDSGQSGASIGGGMKLGFKNAPRKRLPAKD